MPSRPRRALRQQRLGVGKGLAEANDVALGALQYRLKSRAPLDERLLAEIAPVQFEQIEAIDARRHMPSVQKREEVRLTVTTGGNQLAVDDAGLSREPQDGRSDLRKPARKIAALRPKTAEETPTLCSWTW